MKIHREPRLLAAFALAAGLLLPVTLVAAPGQGGGEAPSSEPRIEQRLIRRISPQDMHGLLFTAMAGRGFLGVELTDLTPELRTHFGAPESAGVIVARVHPDSPAAAAGLRVGDVITRLGGAEVASTMDIIRQVRPREAGTVLSVELVRDRRSRKVEVTVAEREREEVDVGRYFEWQSDQEGSPALHMLRELEPGAGGPCAFAMDPEALEHLKEGLGTVDWAEMTRHLHGPASPELERRIEELEKRLERLQAELDKALAEKP